MLNFLRHISQVLLHLFTPFRVLNDIQLVSVYIVKLLDYLLIECLVSFISKGRESETKLICTS